MMRKLAVFGVLATSLYATQTFAHENLAPNPIDTYEYFVEFHKNPRKVLNAPLARRDDRGAIVAFDAKMSPFEAHGLTGRQDAIEARGQLRDRICAMTPKGCRRPDVKPSVLRGYDGMHVITQFLYEPTYLKRLVDIEKAGLLEAYPKDVPWSDSFWPQKLGLIGRRYNDAGFPNSPEWDVNYAYFQTVPPSAIDQHSMSPAEKYDLLVGDFAYGLTNASWNTGGRAKQEFGRVPGWAGLCHGWAPAAIMTPNPVRSVTLMSAIGQPVTFYPSDIKALAALAWGEAPPKFNIVGERCKVSHPEEDEVGRVKRGECWDVNPGVWHMAMVNQIGVNKRGFVFDSTYDLQVWNYPLAAYKYHYFNPQTGKVSNVLAGSAVRVADFSIDKFKKFRSAETKFVVGIAMDVTYSEPVQPQTNPIKTALKKTVKYVYDLELDSAGNIVGGEWYSNWHPDFIWNLPADGKPLSSGEIAAGTVAWDGLSPLPEVLRNAAMISSAKNQPVAAIVQAMLDLSKPAPPPVPPAPPGGVTP